jgi:hypothetical protein
VKFGAIVSYGAVIPQRLPRFFQGRPRWITSLLKQALQVPQGALLSLVSDGHPVSL